METKTLDSHIVRDPTIAGGQPRISGHRITVANIAFWHERLGLSADEIASEYNLSLADVYAALAFYFDHKEDIDLSIQLSEAFIEENRLNHRSKL